MQLPGHEPTFCGLIGHHQNNYATTPMQIINKIFTYTVNSRYLDFGYLEKTLISKRKSGPCFNTEIENQVTKYCRKEKKLLLGSNFSPFPQYFQYICLIKEVKLHSHL